MNNLLELSIAQHHCNEQIRKLEPRSFYPPEEQPPTEEEKEKNKTLADQWQKRLEIINQRITKIIEEAIPV